LTKYSRCCAPSASSVSCRPIAQTFSRILISGFSTDGAALFYTAQSRPQTFDVLRSYVLHRLFTPAPASRIASSGTEAAAAPNGAPSEGPVAGGGTALSTRFPFLHRASTVERDILIVPSGWDSWGKIHALRDGYACAPVSAGWECDVLTERVRRERGLAKGAPELEDEARQQDRGQAAAAADAGVLSAVRLYEDLVAGWKAAPVSHSICVCCASAHVPSTGAKSEFLAGQGARRASLPGTALRNAAKGPRHAESPRSSHKWRWRRRHGFSCRSDAQRQPQPAGRGAGDAGQRHA
jgi:hypothetical protein